MEKKKQKKNYNNSKKNWKPSKEWTEKLEASIALLSATRREKGKRLKNFTNIYLKSLKPQTSPPFHYEMLKVMESTALNPSPEAQKGTTAGSKSKTGTKQPKAEGEKHTGAKKEKEKRGYVAPLGGGDEYITTPTNFSTENELPIDKKEDKLRSRVLFIAPRGFAKSTLVSRFYTLWLACYAKKKDIFLVSATISLAKEHLRIIRQELEGNEKLREDFGNLKSEKWTEDMLILSNGTTIRAKGRGFQIRGFRPDAIICDDLEDEEIIYSKDQREKLEHWFFRTLIPALKPDQTLIYVGTLLHQQSLMSKLRKKDEVDTYEYKALTNGKSIWEELWPTDKLKKLQKEIGQYAFQAEYQNNPISLEDQPVKPHYLDGVKIEGDTQVRCLAIDPAISEKDSSDYRAFALFEKTPHGFREVYSERGRWGIDEQVRRIIDIWKNFGMESSRNDRIVIEEVAFQKIFRDILLKKAREEDLFLPISTAELGVGKDKRPKDKVTRLLSIQHLFEQRLVEVVNPDMRDELLSFPSGDHDDMVDAAVYSIYWLMNFRAGDILMKKHEEEIRVEKKDSFYVDEIRPGVFVATIGEPKMKPNPKLVRYD